MPKFDVTNHGPRKVSLSYPDWVMPGETLRVDYEPEGLPDWVKVAPVKRGRKPKNDTATAKTASNNADHPA